MSGELACLYMDDWAQGEVCWTEAAGGEMQRQFGVIAGMLADASLQRCFIAEVRNMIFAESPVTAARCAVEDVLKGAQLEDGEALVSEVEHVLSQEEASARAKSPGAHLFAAVRRELLRCFWAEQSPDESANDDDAWLLKQLEQGPDDVAATAKASDPAKLREENDFLDAYLMRQIRLKRALTALLDDWEKVDYYSILGVSRTVSDKELKSAYRKMCLKMHPDKGGDKAQFQALQDAYARILEERAQQGKQTGATEGGSAKTGDGGAAASTRAPSQQGRGAPAGGQLALPSTEPTSESGGVDARGPAVPSAAAQVAAAQAVLAEHAAAMDACAARAHKAEVLIGQLKSMEDGVQALREAQQAGEELLALGEEVGKKQGPAFSEAAMEVAESSMVLAAQFSSVPASMLLTDVALSCSFEATRIQTAAEQLWEVRMDTVTTLQTLRTNLQMASIIGSVDTETLRLSLGLVGKAAKRLLAALRQVTQAAKDATLRGQQCRKQAASVVRFAEGRTAAEAECAEAEPEMALPAPEGAEFVPPPQADAGQGDGNAEQQDGDPGQAGGTKAEPGSGSTPCPPQPRMSALLESRLQNDRLLRTLNRDLQNLQRRAKGHLEKKGALSGPSKLPADMRACALELVAEVLLIATEATLAATLPPAELALREFFERHFAFVEACSGGLAMPTDLRAQLVRLAALLDPQSLLSALKGGVKARLVSSFTQLEEEARGPALRVLEEYFEHLCDCVVQARSA